MRRQDRRLTGSMLAARVSQFGYRGIIRSVQRGTITLNGATSNTATINAVDTANAYVQYLGGSDGSTGSAPREYFYRVALTNSTTVTAFVNTAIAVNHFVNFEVIEYWPGVIKSLQTGTQTGTTSPLTATITAVDINKSILGWGGATTTSTAGPQADTVCHRAKIATSTTVQGDYANTAGVNWTFGFTVVEFY